MTTDLTFRQVCDFIKKDEPALIDAVDKILGLTLLCSPIVLGAGALPLLGFLTAKNELTKLGKGIFEKFVAKKDSDFLAHQDRMAKAYGLICFTSFFEALDRGLPSSFRKKLELLPEEKRCISQKALGAIGTKLPPVRTNSGSATTNMPAMSVLFPHPVESFDHQKFRLGQLYAQMAERFVDFLEKLAVWEDLTEEEKKPLQEALAKMPEGALKCFDAQYFELANKYSDFGVWANLQKHDETKKLIKHLSSHLQQLLDQRERTGKTIDVGFASLHEEVLSIPRLIEAARAADVVDGLRRHYEARINDPIIDDKLDDAQDGPRLTFPRFMTSTATGFGKIGELTELFFTRNS